MHSQQSCKVYVTKDAHTRLFLIVTRSPWVSDRFLANNHSPAVLAPTLLSPTHISLQLSSLLRLPGCYFAASDQHLSGVRRDTCSEQLGGDAAAALFRPVLQKGLNCSVDPGW